MHYPLLEMKRCLAEADASLADAAEMVAMLLLESDGHYPIEGAVILANVVTARAVVAQVLPASMQTEIAMEAIQHADDDAFYSRES